MYELLSEETAQALRELEESFKKSRRALTVKNFIKRWREYDLDENLRALSPEELTLLRASICDFKALFLVNQLLENELFFSLYIEFYGCLFENNFPLGENNGKVVWGLAQLLAWNNKEATNWAIDQVSILIVLPRQQENNQTEND
ncbi:MAG: hypothetical protein F6K36_22990 [Symploca sp. SIO3C6]|nr:hypothetical protein [Symploca sp. SIO3C6]